MAGISIYISKMRYVLKEIRFYDQKSFQESLLFYM